MKLTKVATNLHNEAMRLINDRKKLSLDEVEFCYLNYHPAATHNVTAAGAFFTPLEYAQTLSVFCSNTDRVIDMCAGIGMLTYALMNYCRIGHVKCVEINPEYVRIGKRLLPDCEWVEDSAMHTGAWTKGGAADYAISNPPFGKFAGQTLPFQFAVAGMSLEFCKAGAVMIMPDKDHSQENKGDGQGHYPEPSSDYKKFTTLYPQGRITPCSCDICDTFVGVKGVKCMVVNVDKENL